MERVKYVLICLSALLVIPVQAVEKTSNLRRLAALNRSRSSLN